MTGDEGEASGDEIDPGAGPAAILVIGPERNVRECDPSGGGAIEEDLDRPDDPREASAGEDLYISKEIKVFSRSTNQVVSIGGPDQEVEAVTASGVQFSSYPH